MPQVTNLCAGVFSMVKSRAGVMKLSYLYPLFGFILPTVIAGYGFMIPKSCIAGINDLTTGYTGHPHQRVRHLLDRTSKRTARRCLFFRWQP
jgi:hypothetical protein